MVSLFVYDDDYYYAAFNKPYVDDKDEESQVR